MPYLIEELLESLSHIMEEMDRKVLVHGHWVDSAHQENRCGAQNLLEYLAFRSQDRTELQGRLTRLGLSSLGRSEADIRAQVMQVHQILRGLQGDAHAIQRLCREDPIFLGQKNLREKAALLFGRETDDLGTRIMVTMPTEAAYDTALVERLLQSGMNVARINCAHDTAQIWRKISKNIREASKLLGLPCKVMMDLAGPKLRTGVMPTGPKVIKIKPTRDKRGVIVQPALLCFYASAVKPPNSGFTNLVPIQCESMNTLPKISMIATNDTRGKHRKFVVVTQAEDFILAQSDKTVYFETGQVLVFSFGSETVNFVVSELPVQESYLTFSDGDRLKLVADGRIASPALLDDKGKETEPTTLSCAVPEIMSAVEIGHRVKFDDGKFEGVVTEKALNSLIVKIDQTQVGKLHKLRAEKAINFPDTELPICGLTNKDIEDLTTVVEIADLVALSFVNSGVDIDSLLLRLKELSADSVGVILKIETRKGFDGLPELLLTAMKSRRVGVMIARGDLGVEVGWRHIAEIQEEMLWLCAAAHTPIIWATQVLETLAKTGRPTRSEITDAAMAQRAECVMLNKGPFIHKAVRMLNRIIKTMDSHQYKKSARLPKLDFKLSNITE